MEPLKKSNQEMPVVFVHTGPSQVIVAACAAQARAAGCKRVYVISDRIGPWKLLPGVRFFSFSNAEKAGVNDFRKVFQNYSAYPQGYATIIFEKFFALLALYDHLGVDKILFIDSDLLLFRPAEELANEYPADFTGAESPEDNYSTVSPHFMFLARKVCERVCADLMKAYGSKEGHARMKEMWEQKKKIDPEWGVCEMDFLGSVRDSGDFKFMRVNEGNPRVDLNIRAPEGFVCQDGYKAITFEKGLPYGTLEATGERVLFNALHLQGFNKHLAIHYAQLNPILKRTLYVLWGMEKRGWLKWPKAPAAETKNC